MEDPKAKRIQKQRNPSYITLYDRIIGLTDPAAAAAQQLRDDTRGPVLAHPFNPHLLFDRLHYITGPRSYS